jgi:hypothetical protein
MPTDVDTLHKADGLQTDVDTLHKADGLQTIF